MGVYGYIKKIFQTKPQLVSNLSDLSKFPIDKNISKIEYSKENATLESSDWTVRQKEINPEMLMSCVYDFLEELKKEEIRKSMFPLILRDYSSSNEIMEDVVKTIFNDFFVDKNMFQSIIDGSYILNSTYSDLSTFFFNVLVYGHPLLLGYTGSVQVDVNFLKQYANYLVEFDYEGVEHRDTLRNYVICCFYLILKLVFIS